MRYYVLICIFSFLFQWSFAQSKTNDPEVFIGFYNKKECRKKLKKGYHLKDSCFYKNTQDELTVAFKDSAQSFIITLKFVAPETQIPVDYCTQQEIITDCYECSVQYLNRLLHNRSYGWRKTEDNKFVSAYNVHTQLEVNFNTKESISFVFTYIDMPSKEFKTWYYTLNKPD